MSDRTNHPRYKKWDTFNILLVVGLGLFLLFMVSPFLDAILAIGGWDDARRYSCLSNMKQLNLAMHQYEQDNDETPPAYFNTVGHVSWREQIYPYVKSTGVFQCPSDKRDMSSATAVSLPRSYAANMIHGKNGLSVMLTVPLPTTATVIEPAKTIRLVDMRGYDGAEWDITSPSFLPNTGRELFAHVPDHAFYNHPSGPANFLFVDGHVKSMKPSATLSPVNLWTRDNAPFAGQDLQNAQAILKHSEDE